MRIAAGAVILLLTACSGEAPPSAATAIELRRDAASVAIDRRLFGVHLEEPRISLLRYVSALRPGVVRWSAQPSHEAIDAFIGFVGLVPAAPVVAADREGALALLRYANIEKGYRVKWFDVEPSLAGELAAIDPSVQIVDLVAPGQWLFDPKTDDTLDGALAVADRLGHLAEAPPAALVRAGLLDEQDQPRAAYGVYWLYSRHYGNRALPTPPSGDVIVHASLRSDGGLAVVLVNRGTTAREVQLKLDFDAESSESYVLTGPDPAGHDFTINDRAMNEVRAAAGFAPTYGDGALAVEVPASSMKLTIFR